ncbi:MAG: IclR family transcriptional regulator, partial [Burkholderiaceae bacterium]
MTSEPDRYRAPALDKGLDILELLAEQPQGLTRAEIVKAMGRSQSEIYRMLERLVARQYVTRSLEGDRYALGLKLFVLGQRHPPFNRFVARAQPLMDAFSKASEQSCHLGLYDRGNITVVAQVASPGNWGLSIRLGARVSLVDTGSGHVFLAHQTAERRAEMLAEHEVMDGEVPIPADELAA